MVRGGRFIYTSIYRQSVALLGIFDPDFKQSSFIGVSPADIDMAKWGLPSSYNDSFACFLFKYGAIGGHWDI